MTCHDVALHPHAKPVEPSRPRPHLVPSGLWFRTDEGSAKLTRDARPSVYDAASSSRVIGLS